MGLKGTGDSGDIKPMVRALTRSMQLMGGQISSDIQGRLIEKEMANVKNVALVFVGQTLFSQMISSISDPMFKLFQLRRQ